MLFFSSHFVSFSLSLCLSFFLCPVRFSLNQPFYLFCFCKKKFTLCRHRTIYTHIEHNSVKMFSISISFFPLLLKTIIVFRPLSTRSSLLSLCRYFCFSLYICCVLFFFARPENALGYSLLPIDSPVTYAHSFLLTLSLSYIHTLICELTGTHNFLCSFGSMKANMGFIMLLLLLFFGVHVIRLLLCVF